MLWSLRIPCFHLIFRWCWRCYSISHLIEIIQMNSISEIDFICFKSNSDLLLSFNSNAISLWFCLHIQSEISFDLILNCTNELIFSRISSKHSLEHEWCPKHSKQTISVESNDSIVIIRVFSEQSKYIYLVKDDS